MSARERERFVVRRGRLRRILGGYLDTSPGELRFVHGPWGKPLLADAPEVCFSLAHSGSLALLAVATGIPVGVDVERFRPIPDAARCAARFFVPGEAVALSRSRSPSPLTERWFTECWARKEAYLKGTGRGLTAGLDTFEVSVPPAPPRIVWSREPEGARWSLVRLPPVPGCAAALAWRCLRTQVLWSGSYSGAP
ncbi:4'-phosphopantetheinyl transferase superfamily protein [Streptomyces sp. NBC_01142]|uniref:4'-phosphopantetheinyl transferase family protein n=1 Tax=Streptomyces sp. NBC_01142 TaxID=2975865 RepID=UPI00224E1D34|nr:4'-phosphopantetheinyl transferase superfamily protein [Streptomyces sp. NBC_01142]MCX4825191.1 4'-phosphopantetheinyl transferase superfamily protein [Streptomyces sp. NBC_01142]